MSEKKEIKYEHDYPNKSLPPQEAAEEYLQKIGAWEIYEQLRGSGIYYYERDES